MDDRIKKNLVLTKFDFLKILKIQEIYYKIREIFVLKCIKREHVHK